MELLERLTNAEIVCDQCGTKYGKRQYFQVEYQQANCQVCGKEDLCTGVSAYGYLGIGIALLMAKQDIRQQSKTVADYMNKLSDEEVSDIVEQIEDGITIALQLTEEELFALHDMLEYVEDNEEFELDEPCLSVISKVKELYGENANYSLSPAMKAYNEKYGTWGQSSTEDWIRWLGFRDAFEMLNNKTEE